MKIFNFFIKISLVALSIALLTSCEKEDEFTKEEIDFQSINLQSESYWNGSDGSGQFAFGSANFSNNYNASWSSWTGFSFSNTTDITTGTYMNQYSAYVEGGGIAANKYAVAFGDDAIVIFDKEVNLISMNVTNSTYGYFTIRDGSQYSKKFENGDWFKLTIKGYNDVKDEVGTVEFLLADYWDDDYKLVHMWEKVNLKQLKGVRKLSFNLTSTDTGDYGMNTPAYFCMDDLVFEYK